MEHLDFVDELDKLGIAIRYNAVENKEIKFIVSDDNAILRVNNTLTWEHPETRDPLKVLIQRAVDIDEWNHSWHTEVTPYNYRELQRIIKNKIVLRAKDIEFLLAVYFQINHELSSDKT